LDFKNFRTIKFLDPYGDYSVGAKQFDDLIADLRQLEKNKQVNPKQLRELWGFIDECKTEPNSYLKFYGD
jgi:hypothetical protein